MYTRAIMLDRIMRADYVPMEQGDWVNVSDEAKKFVKSLLRLDPKRRPSALKALESPWMLKRNDLDVEALTDMNPEQRHLRAKRLLVLLVTQKVPSTDIVKLERILQRYDPEETGFIALSDLRKALVEAGKVDPSELDSLLADLDLDVVRNCSTSSFFVISSFPHFTRSLSLHKEFRKLSRRSHCLCYKGS